MDSYSINKKYLLKNNKPWFPVFGEFHYSRFDSKFWKRSLLRMKGCGADVVSSYIIWIHHEETEGNISFDGNLDLRRFVMTAAECGLGVLLRIGPWVHAEVRNGGLPDFMLNKGFRPRSNDEDYFVAVEKYFAVLYSQVKGLLHKDGGPVIGIQIENEYGHCGGLSDDAGEYHMRRLCNIAKQVGFDVPYYMATGWGGAVTGGLIPVMGAYPDAPWDTRTEKLEPNPNYVITHERNDKNIGSDHKLGYGLTFNQRKYPYLMIELGSALNSTYHRRIRIAPEDIGAMTLCKLAGGCNLLGFYMFHGGTNPVGKLTTFEENKASGSINDMPVYNYDGYAPIGQWGQYSPTSRELRPILMFVHEFGEKLCRMPAVILPDNPIKADDLDKIRYGFRTDGKSGYLFINNYQRGYDMKNHKNASLGVDLKSDRVTFDNLDIENGDFYFYPFNMKLGRAVLRSAKATPLCRINRDYVFYTDKDPDYVIDGKTGSKIITLTKKEACRATKIYGKKEYLLISDGDTTVDGERAIITYSGKCSFMTYPRLKKSPDNFRPDGRDGELYRYIQKGRVKKDRSTASFRQKSDGVYDIIVRYGKEECEDIILNIGYCASGFTAEINGVTVDDGYYTGDAARISLAYFGYPRKIRLKLTPLYETDNVYLECQPEYTGGRACSLCDVSVTVIRSAEIIIKP